MNAWSWIVPIGVLAEAMLRFPDGRRPSRIWRWVSYAATAGVVAGVALPLVFGSFVAAAMSPVVRQRHGDARLGVRHRPRLQPRHGCAGSRADDCRAPYDNPIGATGAGPVLDVVGAAAGAFVGIGIAGGIVSLGLRLRRAGGVERQQVKLLFYAAAVSVGALVGANLVLPDLMERSAVGNLVWGVATASLSVAVTIALLRYRLFEIDRLISRTATYALVTAVLAGTYVAIAILPAALYGLDSDLLVAAATLASAGLFVPIRRHVQTQMDRRFDRARYDATRIAAAFGTSARDAVDPDRVVGDLIGVVETALRPASAQVWLRVGRQLVTRDASSRSSRCISGASGRTPGASTPSPRHGEDEDDQHDVAPDGQAGDIDGRLPGHLPVGDHVGTDRPAAAAEPAAVAAAAASLLIQVRDQLAALHKAAL